jgi:SAM-dependent methyltransferase
VRWNHNIHYHPIVLAAMPSGCRRALDVGCGEGMLTRELRAVMPSVTGIDIDWPSIELARAESDGGGIEYVQADARRLLPGVRLRRHALGRYSLLWTKPV